MPELPEVEAVCAKLRRDAAGLTIEECRVLRPGIVKPQRPEFVEDGARGARITKVDRCGKHILVHLSTGSLLHVHLRMTGNLYVVPDHRFHSMYARVVCRLSNQGGLIFEDPRALGTFHLEAGDLAARLAREIGLDPLSSSFTPEALARLARQSKQPVKLFLMDQTKLAGLGNIWAAEALFQAAIHPARLAGRIGSQRIERLHQAIREVLSGALAAAAEAYDRPGFYATEEAERMHVYGREGFACSRCARTIRRIPMGGRSTYYCPGCQH